jgi:hypothetical protein
MTDPIRQPHSDPERPLREVTAYLHDELSPEEKAAFEAHLPTCADCQDSVRIGKLVFPRFYELLAADRRPRTNADLLAMLDEAQGKLDAEKRAEAAAARQWPARRRWAPVLPWLVAGAAIAAALLVLLRPAGVIVPQLLPGKARVVSSAPIDPNHPPPPRLQIPDAPFEATLQGNKLHVRVPRQTDDRYVAAALVDSKRGMWLVRRGDDRDRCLFGCHTVEAELDVTMLPPGPFQIYLMVSPNPISERVFEEWVRDMGANDPTQLPRALATREVAR